MAHGCARELNLAGPSDLANRSKQTQTWHGLDGIGGSFAVVSHARLLLVRHGQSEWNAQGRWQGQADPPLTALGRLQAEAGAEQLATIEPSFDIVFSSNLQRAADTGRTIAERLQLPTPTVDPLLAERAAGDWSGLTKADIEQQYPGYLASGQRPPGYESDEDLLPRITGALHRCVDEAPGPNILAAVHGGVVYVIEQTLGAEFARLGNLGARWLFWDDGNLELGERVDLLDGADLEHTIPDQI